VKPGAKAQEGSLAAPEDAKVGASRKLFSWQIRKKREPAEIEYIGGLADDARFD